MTYVSTRRVKNGDANRLYPEDRAIHEWYRFVLSFPPHLVREYIERFGLGHGRCILDPFCGTGTTLVEAKKLGVASVGLEVNPLAEFASRTKGDWTPDPDGLIKHATRVADEALGELARAGISDVCALATTTLPAGLRSLPQAQAELLLADSLSPLPLHKALVLLECLERHRHEPYDAHERLALAKALVYSSSNLHFGPEVGIGPVKPDAPVIAPWLQNIRAMANDLETHQGAATVLAEVHRVDARDLSSVLEPGSIDAVITSPPYPNEKDYTRTTRLELVLLGFLHSKADLRALKQGLVRSNTRNVYKTDDDDRWVADHPEVQRLATAIEARRIELSKTSGFERLYPRVTKLYFGGMTNHLRTLRPFLRSGARLAYVVGDQASYLRVLIRTGQILADIAQTLGYEVIGIDLFRTRLATATRQQLREEVVVLRWPGTK